MKFIQRIVESKLTALLGRPVTFEGMKVSLLSGAIEATGMRVAAERGGEMPLLTIRQIRAEISVARAIKKEIAIKSLEIAGSVLTILRRSDGTTNLPRLRHAGGGERMRPEPDAQPRYPAGVAPEATPRATFDDPAQRPDEEGPRAWDFEAGNVSLRDSAVRFQWEMQPQSQMYQAAIEGVCGHLAAADGTVSISLQASAAGRRDTPVEIGPVRLTARLEGVGNPAAGLMGLMPSAASAAVAIGPVGRDFRVELRSKSPATLAAEGELAGSVDVAALLSLLPAGMLINPRLMGLTLMLGQSGGSLAVSAKGDVSLSGGIRVAELNIRGKDLTLPVEAL